MTHVKSTLVFLVAIVASSPARAEEAPVGEPEETSTSKESSPTNADTPTPLPGEADGQRIKDTKPARKLLWLPRAALIFPRLVLNAATEPIRQLAILEDKHQVQEKLTNFFFNDARTFGIYPIAFFATGLGLNVGAVLTHKDLFGDKGTLGISAGFGGVDRMEYQATLGTGNTLAHGLKLSLLVGYSRDNRGRFFGYGNADLSETDPPTATPQGPRDRVVSTGFNEETFETGGEFSWRNDNTKIYVMQAWRFRESTDRISDSRPTVSAVYDPLQLTRYDERFVDVYHETGVRWALRKTDAVNLPAALPSRGILTETWVGLQNNLKPNDSFGRAGIDIQPFVNLYRGDRVLRLRVRVVTVLGPLKNVPFADLPTLGGTDLLRGYPRGRFRDRISTLYTLEYRYPILRNFAGFLFTDAGRVYSGIDNISFKDMRVGFGGGLILFTGTAFVTGIQLASSREGGFRFGFRLSNTDSFRHVR